VPGCCVPMATGRSAAATTSTTTTMTTTWSLHISQHANRQVTRPILLHTRSRESDDPYMIYARPYNITSYNNNIIVDILPQRVVVGIGIRRLVFGIHLLSDNFSVIRVHRDSETERSRSADLSRLLQTAPVRYRIVLLYI